MQLFNHFRSPSSNGPWSSILPNGTRQTGSSTPTWPRPAKSNRFTPEGTRTTPVESIHSKLERHGERYEQLPALSGQPGALQGILELCARTFDSAAANAAKEAE